MRSSRPLAIALVLGACGAPACGGDDEEAPARTTTVAETEPGAISIAKPEQDDRIKASAGDGRLSARPEVSGTADAGSEVVVTGGCNVEGCVVQTEAGTDGHWTARVRVDAPQDAPEARLTAYYRGLVVGPEDRVELRLAAPATKRASSDGGGGGGGGGGSDRPPVPPDSLDPQPIPAPSGGGGGSGTLVLIGDSLAEGIEPLLPAQLPGWRVTADALTSRPLATGMAILDQTRVPPGAVIAMSLFTNDDPANTGALEEAVRTTVRRAGARGCAVWATIARPPFEGRSYASANALLRRLDAQYGRRLVLVPWAELASRNGWLAGDGVHATPEGYRERARLYAEAARSCG